MARGLCRIGLKSGLCISLLAATLTVLPSDLFAAPLQNAEIDIDALTPELQRSVRGEEHLGMLWWMAPEFWAATGDNQELVDLFTDYTVLTTAVGNLTSIGVQWVTETELRDNIVLRDSQGVDYSPLESPPEFRIFSAMLKGLFGQLLGETGEQMHFLFFPAKSSEGFRIADATQEGSFSFVLKEINGPGEEAYEWKLPLTHAVPPIFCPIGGERLEATWNFCPWHGNRLD